jgi:hypothetical protein
MSRPTKFTKLQSTDPVLNRIQDRVQKTANPTLKNGLTNGVMLTGVQLSTTSTAVPHLLGRAYRGWHLIDQPAAGVTVHRSDPATADTPPQYPAVNPAQVINLAASAPTVVSIWVF